MDLIKKYFPNLTEEQYRQFAALYDIYADWNSKINVVSRKDFSQLYLHHVLHSLSIAKICEFEAGAKVLDVGCGGGFPSIPLAILFPKVSFTCVDSIAKKITVVNGVSKELGLLNVTPINARVESVHRHFDYVISRAVTDMSSFINWVWTKIERGQSGTLPNGIIALKGGDLAEELGLTRKKCTIYSIADIFDEEFFETKKIIFIKK